MGYLILNNCIALKDISPISFCKILIFLSLNRIVIHEGELLQSIIRKKLKHYLLSEQHSETLS